MINIFEDRQNNPQSSRSAVIEKISSLQSWQKPSSGKFKKLILVFIFIILNKSSFLDTIKNILNNIMGSDKSEVNRKYQRRKIFSRIKRIKSKEWDEESIVEPFIKKNSSQKENFKNLLPNQKQIKEINFEKIYHEVDNILDYLPPNFNNITSKYSSFPNGRNNILLKKSSNIEIERRVYATIEREMSKEEAYYKLFVKSIPKAIFSNNPKENIFMLENKGTVLATYKTYSVIRLKKRSKFDFYKDAMTNIKSLNIHCGVYHLNINSGNVMFIQNEKNEIMGFRDFEKSLISEPKKNIEFTFPEHNYIPLGSLYAGKIADLETYDLICVQLIFLNIYYREKAKQYFELVLTLKNKLKEYKKPLNQVEKLDEKLSFTSLLISFL